MLVAVLAISIVGCSGEGEKTNSGTGTGSSQAINSDSNGSDDGNSQGNSDVTYTKYDDLPNSVKIRFHDIYISTPPWRQDEVPNGCNLTNSNDHVVSVTFNVDEEYTGNLEDILDDTYDEFTYAIGERAIADEFGEYKLTTKEKVTLDCGAEAMRFEGTMSAYEHPNYVDYYVYGYSFVYDGATITVGTSIFKMDLVDTEKDTMKDIIDRMVKTIRTQP